MHTSVSFKNQIYLSIKAGKLSRAGWSMNLNKISEKEKGYLFGLFFGDGYKIYDKKSRHYQVDFYLNSKNDIFIINKLSELLLKIGLRINFYQDKRYNCKRIRVYSKEFFNVL